MVLMSLWFPLRCKLHCLSKRFKCLSIIFILWKRKKQYAYLDSGFTLCKKADRKLSALSRISNYMSFEKKRPLLKVFVESQFGYCPLNWMFYSRTTNSKINHIHEKSSRIMYKDNICSFEELLKKDKSFCIHFRNIKSLVIEPFKV